MSRVKVKEPPREGKPRRARYHLKCDHELIGWTDDYVEACDWLNGFGPGTSATIEDLRSWTPAEVSARVRR